MTASCSVEGCGRPRSGRGLCKTHYTRWRRHGDPTFYRDGTLTPAERFWSHVDRSGGEDACWPWVGATAPTGYGRVRLGGQRMAHRVAWMLANGRPAAGYVCHHCDNRPCCNPKHLYEGDAQTNVTDASTRGRLGHKIKKISDEDVRTVRSIFTGQWGQVTQLARAYGLSVSHMSEILSGNERQRVL